MDKKVGVKTDLWSNITLPELLTSTSCSPLTLAIYRLVAGLILIAVNVFSVVTWELFWLQLDGDRWYFHFFYFTNWVLATSTIYFLLVSFLGFFPSVAPTLDKKTKLAVALRVASSSCSVIVTLVYWLAIYDPLRCDTWLNTSLQLLVHGGVLLLLLIDMFLVTLESPPQHLVFPVLFGVVYHIFCTGLRVYTGFWLYPFLDITKPNFVVVYTIFIASFFLITSVQKFGSEFSRPLKYVNKID